MAVYRPVAQHQGPATHCVIHGRALGWLSCTAYAMAMGVDRATLGRKRPSGCDIRHVTGDTTGGLTLPQVAHAASVEYGVAVEVHIGSSVCTPAYAAAQCAKGRGFLLQGNTKPLVGTAYKSTNTGVNHAVWVNEVRGGTRTEPKEAYVYDPAADGRRDMAHAPQWWPWSLVKKFAAALRPWGDGDRRTLGTNRFYVGFVHATPVTGATTTSTSTAVSLRYGAARTKPFPDRMRIKVAAGRRANVRTRPDRLRSGDIAARLPADALFVAYQRVTNGAKPVGSTSRVWYGNRTGNRWVHISGLKNIGGTS